MEGQSRDIRVKKKLFGRLTVVSNEKEMTDKFNFLTIVIVVFTQYLTIDV